MKIKDTKTKVTNKVKKINIKKLEEFNKFKMYMPKEMVQYEGVGYVHSGIIDGAMGFLPGQGDNIWKIIK